MRRRHATAATTGAAGATGCRCGSGSSPAALVPSAPACCHLPQAHQLSRPTLSVGARLTLADKYAGTVPDGVASPSQVVQLSRAPPLSSLPLSLLAALATTLTCLLSLLAALAACCSRCSRYSRFLLLLLTLPLVALVAQRLLLPPLAAAGVMKSKMARATAVLAPQCTIARVIRRLRT